MCLIIVSSHPSKITREICKSALLHNPDGTGVMWYNQAGQLHVRKWMNVPFKKWWPQWREICAEAEQAGSQVAVHWRMATHGTTDETMCHPYRVQASDGVVQMMHNGVIAGYGEKPKVNNYAQAKGYSSILESGAKSDTYEYARMLEAILTDVGKGLVNNLAFRELLGSDIASRNKLVFGIDKNPEKDFKKVNPASGVEYQGHWFSNTYAWDCERLTHGVLKDESIWSNYGGWNSTKTPSSVPSAVVAYDTVTNRSTFYPTNPLSQGAIQKSSVTTMVPSKMDANQYVAQTDKFFAHTLEDLKAYALRNPDGFYEMVGYFDGLSYDDEMFIKDMLFGPIPFNERLKIPFDLNRICRIVFEYGSQ